VQTLLLPKKKKKERDREKEELGMTIVPASQEAEVEGVLETTNSRSAMQHSENPTKL
jgi:hypothetical protein